jgi:hypothetical protein
LFFFQKILKRGGKKMSEITKNIDPLRRDYAAMTLADIAARPETIASRQRVEANRQLSDEARKAKLDDLMVRVKAQLSRVPAGR